MSSSSIPSSFDQMAARVERLLVRYEELHRTNTLQAQRIEALEAELALYRVRYATARQHLDELMARLPTATMPASVLSAHVADTLPSTKTIA